MAQRTTFGGGLRSGSGVLVSSVRIGPGLLLVGDGTPDALVRIADDLNRDHGFTVLVMDRQATVGHEVAVAREGAEHLRANWHPRVGVVGLGSGAAAAVSLACDGVVDAGVVLDGWVTPESALRSPLQAHLGAHADLDLAAVTADLDRLVDAGADVEAAVYEGAEQLFAVPGSVAFDPGASQTAWERIVDFLRHHLA